MPLSIFFSYTAKGNNIQVPRFKYFTKNYKLIFQEKSKCNQVFVWVLTSEAFIWETKVELIKQKWEYLTTKIKTDKDPLRSLMCYRGFSPQYQSKDWAESPGKCCQDLKYLELLSQTHEILSIKQNIRIYHFTGTEGKGDKKAKDKTPVVWYILTVHCLMSE